MAALDAEAALPALLDASPRAEHAPWVSAESYWVPRHIVESAWLEHAPFASWLLARVAPRQFVELGTHNGFSYFTFCDGVVRLGLGTQAVAVDTWLGDDQAGFYGEDVYSAVQAVNSTDYAEFSRLVRSTFDDALEQIPDGSVDLIHFDGRHSLADIEHDFHAWLPKVSNRGIAIFHDIAERQEGFGVWQLWEDLATRYPSFAFEHGHGLGVLGIGRERVEGMQALFGASEAEAERIRSFYHRLGQGVAELWDVALHMRELEAQLVAERASSDDLRARLANATAEVAHREAVIDELHASTSWRLTRPVRALGSALKRPRR